MNYAIVVVTPPNYRHSGAFAEVAEALCGGLQALGRHAYITHQLTPTNDQQIILGANLLPSVIEKPMPNAIVYNLEQAFISDTQISWFNTNYVEILKQYQVWDYDLENADNLRKLGIHITKILPLGYTPNLSRIVKRPLSEVDIDVLFFGSLNARRSAVIEEMKQRGLNVVCLFGTYGAERDEYIARSKIILNMHFYDTKILEMVRIFYLLSNQCLVLSEHSFDPKADAAVKGVVFAAYADLPAMAEYPLNHPDQGYQMAEKGFKWMQSQPMTQHLAMILDHPLDVS